MAAELFCLTCYLEIIEPDTTSDRLFNKQRKKEDENKEFQEVAVQRSNDFSDLNRTAFKEERTANVGMVSEFILHQQYKIVTLLKRN